MDLNIPIQHLFPSSEPGVDYDLRDDGNGPYIEAWYRTEPQPTQAELEAVFDVARANRDARQAAERVRAERDRLIDAAQRKIDQSLREQRMGRAPRREVAALDRYVQALCDVPDQAGFPHAIVWPTEPGAK